MASVYMADLAQALYNFVFEHMYTTTYYSFILITSA